MKNIIKLTIKTILLLALIFSFNQKSFSQVKLQKSAGGYHGELDFPISWSRYYSYAEWTKIMHDLQMKYPNLADIQSIGKSRMGRDQFLLTITNKETGSHSSKAAMWVDGAIHGNEVNGITCSLYLAWYLLTRYDYDPYIHELLDKRTFYILPGLNVDANEGYVSFPNTENNPREPYRPTDDDGDGLYDEDPSEDVDGDGELSTMYIEDLKGTLRLSADKRQFIQVEDNSFVGLRFRRIGAEGYDNDGDGQINEDDLGGPDPNRNYPYGWSLSAGSTYPMSESETRNVFEFQLAHKNIFAAFNYHNTGRLIMFAAPMAATTLTPEAQRVADQTTATRLEEMRKTNKYAQLFSRQVSPEYRQDMDVQTEIVTQGAYLLKDYTPTIGGLSGQAAPSAYFMLGAYSYLIELWGSPTWVADINNDGRVSGEENMKWIDLDLKGDGWIMPHKAKHADLGDIWIGGSSKKHISRTPPSRYMLDEAEKNAFFVLYCVNQFPKVEMDEINVKPLSKDVYQIDVTVKNDKVYPTSSDRSVQLKRSEMDKLTYSVSDNITIIETKGSTPVEPATGRGGGMGPGQRAAGQGTTVATGKEISLRLKGRDKQTFRYLLAMKGSSGWMEFTINSKNGGTDKKKIEIKIE